MLVKLLLFRLCPVVCLKLCKKRKQIKLTGVLEILCYAVCFLSAVWKIFYEEKWKGILWVLGSLFPHSLCYGFAVWLIWRCLWNVWSVRVWNRIYLAAIWAVMVGILMELYWNPAVLRFVSWILK